MSGLPTPFVAIQLAGAPLDLVLGRDLLEFSYRDVHHGEVDQIEFSVADGKGLWRGPFGPEEGTPMTATIGYAGLQGATFCGTYEVDEPEAEGAADGDRARFKGLSAFTSTSLRTARSEAYDEITLAEIVARVAARHGFEVIGPVPDIKFVRITQSKTSDLAFLLRLAEDWGCYCSAKGPRLTFVDRQTIDALPPTALLDVWTGELLSWRLRRSARALYATALLRYVLPGTRTTVDATAQDPRIRSGDELMLDDKVENQGQADRLAIAKLLRANDGWSTGSMDFVGHPGLVAGQVLQLGLSFGRYAGRWLVTSAAHRMDAAGYVTSVEVKGL